MKYDFDNALVETWERVSTRGVALGNFLTRYFGCLSCWAEPADLTPVMESVKAGTDPDSSRLRKVLNSSNICQTIFHCHALRLDFVSFLELIGKELSDLENLDFAPQDVAVFQKMMTAETANLVKHGMKSYDKKEMTVNMFSENVTIQVEDANDFWQYPFAAKIKSIAVNTSKVPILPWEAAIFPDGVPGERSTIDLPDALLSDIRNVRDAALNLLGSQPVTISMALRILMPHKKSLCELERTWELEMAWLSDVAQIICARKVHAAILQTLPTADGTSDRSPSEVRH